MVYSLFNEDEKKTLLEYTYRIKENLKERKDK